MTNLIDTRKFAKVDCGDISWKGRASSFNEAIIGAFAKGLPKRPSELVRVNVGNTVWQYIDFRAAKKIAGYTG